MATSTRAMSFRFAGWTGGITVDNGTSTTITTQAFGSAISAAVRLRTAGPAWLTVSLASSGRLVIASTSGTFTMTGTGNTLTRLGFSGTHTGATSYAAAAVPIATHSPRALDVCTFDEAAAASQSRAVGLYSSHVRRARGAAEWRQPRIEAPLTAARWLAFLEDWDAYLATPAELDIGYDAAGVLTAQAVQVDGARVRVQDPKTLFGELSISATEAVP